MLAPREQRVLALLATGLGNKQIARRLELSPKTVKNYLYVAYQKIGVQSRAEAIIWWLAHGEGAVHLTRGTVPTPPSN